MKKLLSALLALSLFCFAALHAHAASVPVEEPSLNAKAILLPVGSTGHSISLLDLAHISIKDFEALSGRKMKVWDKVSFKLGQRKLRHSMDADGNLDKDAARKLAKGMAEGEGGFHLGGFALGFLLGLIGIIIAYVIKDEKKKSRVKWAWIGLASIVALQILILVL